MSQDKITIPYSAFTKLVSEFAKEMYKRNPDADRATEPIDVPFLDHMLDLQFQHLDKRSVKNIIKGDKNESR